MKKPFEGLTVKKAREQAAAAGDTLPQTLANVQKIPVPKFQPSAAKIPTSMWVFTKRAKAKK